MGSINSKPEKSTSGVDPQHCWENEIDYDERIAREEEEARAATVEMHAPNNTLEGEASSASEEKDEPGLLEAVEESPTPASSTTVGSTTPARSSSSFASTMPSSSSSSASTTNPHETTAPTTNTAGNGKMSVGGSKVAAPSGTEPSSGTKRSRTSSSPPPPKVGSLAEVTNTQTKRARRSKAAKSASSTTAPAAAAAAAAAKTKRQAAVTAAAAISSKTTTTSTKGKKRVGATVKAKRESVSLPLDEEAALAQIPKEVNETFSSVGFCGNEPVWCIGPDHESLESMWKAAWMKQFQKFASSRQRSIENFPVIFYWYGKQRSYSVGRFSEFVRYSNAPHSLIAFANATKTKVESGQELATVKEQKIAELLEDLEQYAKGGGDKL